MIKTTTSIFSFALLLAFVLSNTWAAKPVAAKSSKASEFHTPKDDREGLRQKRDLRPYLPNVFLIGDSISIAYTIPVAGLLKDEANVQRPKVNCGNTEAGLAGLTEWLGNQKWDVIHFNWGLHDLKYVNPEVKRVGNLDKVNGTQMVPLEAYEKNIELLVEQLEMTGAKLIWASTSHVPEGEPGRFAGDEIKYNAVARKVMERHGIPVNDLHALTTSFAGKYSRKRGDVHYTKEGSQKIAAQVADAIRQQGLAKKK